MPILLGLVMLMAEPRFSIKALRQYAAQSEAQTPNAAPKTPPRRASMKGPMAMIAIADAADAATTNAVLARPWTHEVNPLLPDHRWGNTAAQAGMTALKEYLVKKYGPKHPKLAWILAGADAAVGALDTLHNVRELRQPASSLQHAPDGSWYDPHYLTIASGR